MEGLPDPRLLEGSKEVEDTEPVETVEASELVGSSKRLPNNRCTVTKLRFLPALGLPTIPNKLARKIWDLEFVEMEEFLPIAIRQYRQWKTQYPYRRVLWERSSSCNSQTRG